MHRTLVQYLWNTVAFVNLIDHAILLTYFYNEAKSQKNKRARACTCQSVWRKCVCVWERERESARARVCEEIKMYLIEYIVCRALKRFWVANSLIHQSNRVGSYHGGRKELDIYIWKNNGNRICRLDRTISFRWKNSWWGRKLRSWES